MAKKAEAKPLIKIQLSRQQNMQGQTHGVGRPMLEGLLVDGVSLEDLNKCLSSGSLQAVDSTVPKSEGSNE